MHLSVICTELHLERNTKTQYWLSYGDTCITIKTRSFLVFLFVTKNLLNSCTAYAENVHHLLEDKSFFLFTVFHATSQCLFVNVGNNVFLAPGGLVVSVLITRHKIGGFKPGRGRWIFKGNKNPQHDFLRRGSKAVYHMLENRASMNEILRG
jgi:hypothetical protein